jgi:hypothetical protein
MVLSSKCCKTENLKTKNPGWEANRGLSKAVVGDPLKEARLDEYQARLWLNQYP